MEDSDGDERGPLIRRGQLGVNEDILVGAAAAPGAASFLARARRRKSVEEVRRRADAAGGGLARTLRLPQLVFLGVGAVVGAGIYSLVGQAARITGPSLVVSMAIVGVAALLVGVCFAELASAYPVSGSSYTFVYLTFGEGAAFLVAWALVLEYTVAAAALARAWSHYLASALDSFGTELPPSMLSASVPVLGSVNVAACAVVLVVCALVYTSLARSMRINAVAVVVNVAGLLLFVGASLPHAKAENLDNFWAGGMPGLFRAAALLLFAYVGFDALATMSEEVVEPRRTVPRAIIWTLSVTTALYLAVAGALVASTASATVDRNSALAEALAGTPWARATVATAATLSLLSAIFGCVLGQSRLWFAVSRDGLIPPAFSRVDDDGEGGRTPGVAVLLAGLPAAGAALLFPIESLSNLTSLGACTAFACTAAIVLHRRHDRPDGSGASVSWRVALLAAVSVAASVSVYAGAHLVVVASLCAGVVLAILPFFSLPVRARTAADEGVFRTPLMPLTAVLALVMTLHIVVGQGVTALLVFAAWETVGLAAYAAYGASHSRLGRR